VIRPERITSKGRAGNGPASDELLVGSTFFLRTTRDKSVDFLYEKDVFEITNNLTSGDFYSVLMKKKRHIIILSRLELPSYRQFPR
jgi:hypothetical protein